MKKQKRTNKIMHKIFQRKRLPLYIYLLLLIASAVNISFNGGAFSYVIFYAFLFYLPLAVVYIVYSMAVLNIYQEIGHKTISKNTSEKYSFMIENTGFIPIGGISFMYDSELMSFSDDFTTQNYSLSFRERITIKTRMRCFYAGSYDTGISHYVIRDIFGIIGIKRKVRIPVRIHVLPLIKKLSSDDIRLLNEIRESGNLFSINAFEENLGNDLRKYVPGDSIANIHWKNFARTGEMYVRLPEKQEIDMLCIALITEAMDGTLEMIKQRDRFFEYLVSIAEYFGMMNKPLVIYFYNMGVKSCLIDSPVKFRDFYTSIPENIGHKTAAGHDEELLKTSSKEFGNVILFREKGCELNKAYGNDQ